KTGPKTDGALAGGGDEKHQVGKAEREAARGRQAGQADEEHVLQRSQQPALVAADELDQGRRILLPTQVLLRQDTHVVAGASHESRLDLVVTENVAAQDPLAGQWRDRAMRLERRYPQDGVVAPVWPAGRLPPRASGRPCA